MASHVVAINSKEKFKKSGVITGIYEHDPAVLAQAEGPAYIVMRGEMMSGTSHTLLCELDMSDVLTLETKTRVIVTGIFHPNLPEWVGYGPDYWLEGCSIVTDQYIGIVSK